MKVSLYILLVLFWTQSVAGQESCRIFTTCRECISSTLACAWCNDRKFYIIPDAIRPLCDTPEALLEANCPPDKIMNPKSSTPIRNGSTLQLNPSKYEMSLRTQTVQNVSIRVTPQQDFPLDLYILMDVSNTMSVFLQLAQDAAGDILSAVKGLTSDSRLGFGTFVEKRVRPFIDPNDPEHDADTFKNVQPLTTNLTQFQSNINTVTTFRNQVCCIGMLFNQFSINRPFYYSMKFFCICCISLGFCTYVCIPIFFASTSLLKTKILD